MVDSYKTILWLLIYNDILSIDGLGGGHPCDETSGILPRHAQNGLLSDCTGVLIPTMVFFSSPWLGPMLLPAHSERSTAGNETKQICT